ncbi:hypothetical protein [Staphylococcus chromogenes]|uniref:hypothetical protein n=1 Tax=Staphylococcus chromogenes TaxID=46126 RepID=UPI001C3C9427|nr:hypothetical protein [Staphylococcus chromogenes]MBV5138479.1 hypothetical protein [Staphylococcus chromogenes]MBW6089973.1 hypothetical protein [Staphylococcus chromogenes]MCD9062715.1 hypothetical protein [Staphylococcus chromogenes]
MKHLMLTLTVITSGFFIHLITENIIYTAFFGILLGLAAYMLFQENEKKTEC